MRLVIDSNVWISALVFGGNPRKLLELVVRQGHTIVASEEIFSETRRVLNNKFPDFVDDFEKLIVVLKPHMSMAKLGSIDVKVSRDPNDDYIIETALTGGAKYIVSGDKDLLELNNYQEIIICDPKSAINALTSA